MAKDALLGELERQQKYLDDLPEVFDFPLFNARRAVESQRRSGYRDTAAAAREIVDNAIEAGATDVEIVFDKARSGHKPVVDAIAFVDNGSGMLPRMARYALTWGGGTHFDDPSYIGRFGFGLPNASINQTRLVEVYTRTRASEPFVRTRLDLDTFNQWGIQSIPPEESAELPAFVTRHLKQRGNEFDHGTVIVWSRPDRLTYRSPSFLKEHLVGDFGVTYRYMLRPGDKHGPGVGLEVEGVAVEPVDPLFLLPEGRYFVPEKDGGARLIHDRFLPVRFVEDEESGDRRLELIKDESALADAQGKAGVLGVVEIRIARLPVGFAVDRGRRRGSDATEANRRFDIRKEHRGMSFVRVNRELQTLDAFPRSQSDVANGLGRWPLLQGYAYHWGVEVRFNPDLDEVFGITNDKQGVRPIEDFWRVLAEAEIDEALRLENQWQSTNRKRQRPQPPSPTVASPAEQSASAADVAMGTRPQVPQYRLNQVRADFEQKVQAAAANSAESVEEVRAALERETQRRPYRVEYVDEPHGPVYEPTWDGSQLVVRINQGHPYPKTLYGDLFAQEVSQRAKEFVDLLFITLGREEVSADEDTSLIYQAHRKYRWSPFLDTASRALTQRLEGHEEDNDEDGPGPEPGGQPAA